MSYLKLHTLLRDGNYDQARELCRSLASDELLAAFDAGQIQLTRSEPDARLMPAVTDRPLAAAEGRPTLRPAPDKVTSSPQNPPSDAAPAATVHAKPPVGETRARTPYAAAPLLVNRAMLLQKLDALRQTQNLANDNQVAMALGFQSQGQCQSLFRRRSIQKSLTTQWGQYLAEILGPEILVS